MPDLKSLQELVGQLRYRQRMEDGKLYILLELPLPSTEEMAAKLRAVGANEEEVRKLEEDGGHSYDVSGVEALTHVAHLHGELESLVKMARVIELGRVLGIDLDSVKPEGS